MVETYARKITNFFQKIFEIFWIFLFLFFFLKGAGPDQPSHLSWAKTGPTQRHVNYSAAACRNGFYMQRPRRRRRQCREENHLRWWGSLVVLGMSGLWLRRLRLWWRWPESAVGGRRKSCRGERKAGRRRERRSRWLLCHWWGARLMEIMVVK